MAEPMSELVAVVSLLVRDADGARTDVSDGWPVGLRVPITSERLGVVSELGGPVALFQNL